MELWYCQFSTARCGLGPGESKRKKDTEREEDWHVRVVWGGGVGGRMWKTAEEVVLREGKGKYSWKHSQIPAEIKQKRNQAIEAEGMQTQLMNEIKIAGFDWYRPTDTWAKCIHSLSLPAPRHWWWKYADMYSSMDYMSSRVTPWTCEQCITQISKSIRDRRSVWNPHQTTLPLTWSLFLCFITLLWKPCCCTLLGG